MAHVSLQLNAALVVPFRREVVVKRNWRLRALTEALREPGTSAGWPGPSVVPWVPKPPRPAAPAVRHQGGV